MTTSRKASKKKIVYISGSRSEYGLMQKTLHRLEKFFDLRVVVTHMHLSSEFGNTIKEIRKDEFKIKTVKTVLGGDTMESMVKSLGDAIVRLAPIIKEINPGLVILEGDRPEILAGAIVGSFLRIPIMHLGGGDLTGSIDNKTRYAITASSDYHLVGNSESHDRLIRTKLIPKDRIFNVGEPGLDDIRDKNYTSKKTILEKYFIDSQSPFILFVQHPDTTEKKIRTKTQIEETLKAIELLKIRTVAVYANADAGGRCINQALEKYGRKLDFLTVYKNIGRRDFLGLMNICDVMLGNSSSSLIELPSLKKPCICVGSRQKRRLRAKAVIDTRYNYRDIAEAVKKALNDKKFRQNLKNLKNPYGDGRSADKITKIVLQVFKGHENY